MYLRAHSPIAHMLNKLCSFSLYSFQWWKTDLRCSRTISGDCGLQTENRWGNAGLIRDAIIKHNVPLSRVMIMEATYTCSCQNKGALADIWRNKKYDALVIHLPWELLKQVKSMTPNVVQRWSYLCASVWYRKRIRSTCSSVVLRCDGFWNKIVLYAVLFIACRKHIDQT